MKIKTIIVYDEPHAIEVIETYTRNFSEIELVGKCNNAIQAFQLLQKGKMVSKQRISVLEELLPEDKFVLIHRSFIVSIEKIESYRSYAIDMLGKELPIGRNYKGMSQKT